MTIKDKKDICHANNHATRSVNKDKLEYVKDNILPFTTRINGEEQFYLSKIYLHHTKCDLKGARLQMT